jgi:hypothetical protein
MGVHPPGACPYKTKNQNMKKEYTAPSVQVIEMTTTDTILSASPYDGTTILDNTTGDNGITSGEARFRFLDDEDEW